MPVVTIEDLGILRDLEVDEARRHVVVKITPTYSGCPAMGAIDAASSTRRPPPASRVEVQLRLSPAWTTDWMSERGRERLREFGIAPPAVRAAGLAEGARWP